MDQTNIDFLADADDERQTLMDAATLDYIPTTPEFWEKMAVAKPSGLQLQCYFYIASKTSLYTSRSNYVNYKEMAESLHSKYNSVMPCITWLIKHKFVVRFDRKYGVRFYVPDFDKVREINDEKKHRSQAERLQKLIDEALKDGQEKYKRELVNSEKAYIARKVLAEHRETYSKAAVDYLNLPDMFDESSEIPTGIGRENTELTTFGNSVFKETVNFVDECYMLIERKLQHRGVLPV